MDKRFKIIYIILVLAVCAVPLALMPFVKSDAKIEKRELNKFPKYIDNGKLNEDYSTGFEGWLNDRVPFRAYMLSASNYLRTEVLKQPSSNVICGKEGWLYYESESKDYMDSNALSDADIEAAAVSLSLIEEHVRNNGGQFTFAIAPNKSSIYPENMPECYNRADSNNLTRLNDALDKAGVTHVDLKALLTDKKDEGIYHRRDSHWNYKGALIGYNLLLDSLKREHETYDDMEFKKTKSWRGDLDKLLYPAGGVMDYQYEYDIDYSSIMFTGPGQGGPKERLLNYMSDKEQGDDMIVAKCKTVKDDSSLYMVRDSFGRALLPFMINAYKNSTFRRTKSPDITAVPEGSDFCYELVERNIDQLVESAPFMYAPKREEMKVESYDKGEGAETFAKEESYGLRLYGKLPNQRDANQRDGPGGQNSHLSCKSNQGDGPFGYRRVYIVLENDMGCFTYEAFPIYDQTLMKQVADQGDGPSGQTNQGDGPFGYSAVISPEEGLKGEYSVHIITGGRCYAADNVNIN